MTGNIHRWRGVSVLGCVVAVVAAGLLWLLWPRGGEVEEPAPKAARPTKSKPRKVRPQEKPKKDAPERKAVTKVPEVKARETAVKEPERKVETHVQTTAATNTEEVAESEEETERKEPLFQHGTEQLLALATPLSPGAPVPPLPMITDEAVAEDLAKAMGNTIKPSPDDTERTLEMKLNVAQQKEEFRDLRKEGMTFVEYVNALRDKFNEDAAYLAEAQKLDESLFNDKDVSDKDYKAYREELNKSLRERGLPELESR